MFEFDYVESKVWSVVVVVKGYLFPIVHQIYENDLLNTQHKLEPPASPIVSC